VVDVPRNHFAMMEEHMDNTGQTVRDWLAIEKCGCSEGSAANREIEESWSG
jgi:hypothetical protein